MAINERLLYKMVLEQKIRLVTSADLYRSSAVDGYEFPVMEMSERPFSGEGDYVFTQFPRDRALASAFNSALTESVYRALGEEARAYDAYACFSVSNLPKNLTDDGFLSAKFLSAKINGLTQGRQAVCFDQAEIGNRSLNDLVYGNAKPTFCLVHSPVEAVEYFEKYKSGSLVCGVACSPEEAARYFYLGCTFVFLEHDFSAALISYLTERTRAYREAYADYRAEKITLGEMDRRARNMEIFDEDILTNACDRMISALRAMKEAGDEAKNSQGFQSYSAERKAVFDEVSHAGLARRAAQESFVLLKNNNGILPLDAKKRVAVVGECAKEAEYQRSLFNHTPTTETAVFEAINGYEINAVGFAAGYRKGEERADLLVNAVELCEKADCALVFLSAEPDSDKLPKEQLDLLQALCMRGVQVIAVVDCDSVPDLSFAEKCRAVLLSFRLGQAAPLAALDVVTGAVCPSGKLTQSVVYKTEKGQKAEYPFGFGLTYTEFAYRNLTLNENGISCTVENVGDRDAYATVFLYVQKNGSQVFDRKTLRGVAKVFIKKNDAARVEIPFDETTFRYYDKKKKRYRTDGGEYTITVSANRRDDQLKGSLTLADHKEPLAPESEVVEKAEGEEVQFSRHRKDGGLYREKNGHFGVKLFLAIVLTLYCDAICAVFAFMNIVPVTNILLHYGIIGGVALIVNVLFIVYVVVIAKHRSRPILPENVVITDLVNQVKEFDEICKETYKRPVRIEDEPDEDEEDWEDEDEDEEDEGTEEPAPAQTASEPEEPSAASTGAYTADFRTVTEEEPKFEKHLSFGELAEDFRTYAHCVGIDMEPASARLLFAALTASRVVVLNTINRDLIPDFCRALKGYYKGACVMQAQDDWKSVENLLWSEEGSRCVLSDFTNTLNVAGRSREKKFVAVLADVGNNLTDWFGDFLAFADCPPEAGELQLNRELKLPSLDNVSYILIPQEGALREAPRALTNVALNIEIGLKRCYPSPDLPEPKAISRTDFGVLLADAREKYFLPEKIWKKFDELFETIAAGERFRFGNKNTIQSEKFTAALMECGADVTEALQMLLLAKIAPVLKLTKFYKQDDGDRMLFSTIEKLFPDDDLPRLRRLLIRRDDEEKKTEKEEPAPAQAQEAEPQANETPEAAAPVEPEEETTESEETAPVFEMPAATTEPKEDSKESAPVFEMPAASVEPEEGTAEPQETAEGETE